MAVIDFNYQGKAYPIDLDMGTAPVTIGKLLAILPVKIDIHCAKIAGKHIFWHAPFVSNLEGTQDILQLAPGTFAYWPDRQFLEIIYDVLQPEVAHVCVLGHVRGSLDWLRELGREVIENQGRRWIMAELTMRGQMGKGEKECKEGREIASPVVFASAGLASLRAARSRIWRERPQELDDLACRHGVMLPYGPLSMAEGEFRKLHELLFALRGASGTSFGAHKAAMAAFLLDAFYDRIDGFCGLHDAGEVLRQGAALYREEAEFFMTITDELILYSGRMAAWLDLYIPWHRLNQQMLDSVPALLPQCRDML